MDARWRVMPACGPASARGIALVLALLTLSLVSALALGLSLVVSVDPLAAANQREATAAAYVARAGVELAIGELTAAASWDAWLSGEAVSSLTDGSAMGARRMPGGESLDIGRLTSQLTCGRDSPCSDAQMNASVRDRPWGVNNPRWRPFLYGTTTDLGLAGMSTQHYLIAWIGDDGGERDGVPGQDGPDEAGGGVVRVVVQAFGPLRSRQTVAVQVSRRCAVLDEERVCAPGLGVHAWHDGVRAEAR